MSGLSVFRLLRSIRVLRVISHSETMSSLLASFMKGMQSLSWVILLLVLFLYIFAVLAKSFFGDSEVDGLQHASSHLIDTNPIPYRRRCRRRSCNKAWTPMTTLGAYGNA